MEHYPKISIITPSFNQGTFIADAIESVIGQNYPNFEHIIIDNCSTDDTIEILRRYGHLRWLSEPDRGQSHALNKGIRMATGDWVVWLNADDLLAEGALWSYARGITDDSSVDVMYGHVKYITESGQYLRTYAQIKFRYIFILFGVYGPPSSGTLFRKEILNAHSLSEEYHYAMDTEWFLRCGRIIKTRLVNEITSCFRISFSSKTSGMISGNAFSEKHHKERQRYREEFLYDRMIFIPDIMKNYIYRSVRFLLLGVYYLLKLRYLKYIMYADQKPIVMFTTIHSANDHRIYYKEARSLAKKYPVVIVAPMRNQGTIAELPHIEISFIENRLLRFISNIRHIPKISRLRPRVLHIHDPELLPIALIVKLLVRSKIVYDAHENQHLDILQKDWLPAPIRKSILSVYRIFEHIVLRNSDGVILAEDSFIDTYNRYRNTEFIRNYPIVDRQNKSGTISTSSSDVIRLGYIGSVQRIRGALEMLHAVACIKHSYGRKVRLDVIGGFENSELESEAEQLLVTLDIQDSVIFHGILPHESAMELLAQIHLGFALFHPLPTLQRILPVKLYEYMVMGKAIIAADIPLWHSVIGKANCGIFVDPFDKEQIAKSTLELYDTPSKIDKMGENGYNAVIDTYNWKSQEQLLLELYKKIV